MLVAHLVVRNEADRYLYECLAWASRFVDHIHVYDDQSTDETPFIAEGFGAEVHIRDENTPPFLENESKFRQAAWESMGERGGDWVLCLDADEFLTGPIREHATGMPKVFHVDEVFEVKDGQPRIRVDGYWDQITAARLVPWTNASKFPKGRLGCGSLPKIFKKQAFETLDQPRLLHFGYAKRSDREAKYLRYKGLPGHNPRHIESILKKGDLRSL